MNDMVITDYYKNLPRGTKDKFVRDVADATGMSISNVNLKLRNGRWSMLEEREVKRLIENRRGI